MFLFLLLLLMMGVVLPAWFCWCAYKAYRQLQADGERHIKEALEAAREEQGEDHLDKNEETVESPQTKKMRRARQKARAPHLRVIDDTPVDEDYWELANMEDDDL